MRGALSGDGGQALSAAPQRERLKGGGGEMGRGPVGGSVFLVAFPASQGEKRTPSQGDMGMCGVPEKQLFPVAFPSSQGEKGALNKQTATQTQTRSC